MVRIKIFGAGSMGNHLAQASRRVGWEVVVVDPDPAALQRMRNEVYPKRYGAWDHSIQLFSPKNSPKGGFDVICVCTPPDVRMAVARETLEEKPNVLQLEKPLSAPLLESSARDELLEFFKRLEKAGTKLVVGYEYVLGDAAGYIEQNISQDSLGKIETLEVSFREHWGGIFEAHPWLCGPRDTYLGFWQRGGGASGEHSHAIHFFEHFASLLGIGRITHVSAAMDMVNGGGVCYDRACFMTVRTERGLLGRICQDVVRRPPRMRMRIQGSKRSIEWSRYVRAGTGTVEVVEHDDDRIEYSIKRPDDFYHEIVYLNDVLTGKLDANTSPISFERGLHVLDVVTAAHLSRLQESMLVEVK